MISNAASPSFQGVFCFGIFSARPVDTTMDNIYTGIWTNWSRGAILGSTLTVTKQYGNLLIAFMALFIGFVASRLWKISCLALHRSYSSTDKRSPIHHQRQVILRNSRTAESALFEILCLLGAWRKSQFQPIAGLIKLHR